MFNMTQPITNPEFAVILVEQMTGGFKLRFRSRCALDCSRFGEQFADGHQAAAPVPSPLDEVQPRVLTLIREAQ